MPSNEYVNTGAIYTAATTIATSNSTATLSTSIMVLFFILWLGEQNYSEKATIQ